jgi:hypothetical protein
MPPEQEKKSQTAETAELIYAISTYWVVLDRFEFHIDVWCGPHLTFTL